MSGLYFVGALLLAFGPSAALFLLFIAKRAQLLIATLASAFFWLLAVFISAIIWVVIPPLQGVHVVTVVLGALIQEAVRYGFIGVYARVEARVARLTPRGAPAALNDVSSAVASGLGFGAMHSIIMYGSILGSTTGDAALYVDTCSGMSMFTLSAMSALLFQVLHLFLMVLAFDAFRRQSKLLWARVVGLHLLASSVTLLGRIDDGCYAVPPLLVAVAGLCFLFSWRVMRAFDYTGRRPSTPAPMMRRSSSRSSRK